MIAFEDVSAGAGIEHVGEAHGMAWGDINGDGWPDLWVGNHREAPSLYLNLANGAFADIAAAVAAETEGDAHGAAWADFDGDGDQDLVELNGAVSGTGSDPNHLFVNQDGILLERAALLGVDYELGRGRTPLWFDADGDGVLDLLIANMARPDQEAPTALFRQAGGSFLEANALAGFQANQSSFFGQLTDLTGDRALELVVHGWPYPQRIYEVGSLPFAGLQAADLGIPLTTGTVLDVIYADFFNDLLPDIFLMRAFEGRSGALLISSQELRVSIQLDQGEYGIRFRTPGEVAFEIYGTNMHPVPPDGILIGLDGAHPISTTFTLSPADPAVAGIFPHAPASDQGVYIGFDPGSQDWYLYCSGPAGCELSGIFLTAAAIMDWQTIGFQASGTPPRDRFLDHGAGGYSDITVPAGLGNPTDCGSAVSADFDNDMDLDLYLVCTHPVANLPNILYQNEGDGTFTVLPGAGGAEGSPAGRGDGVAAADYDRDGFIDLFVTHGKGSFPFNQGPHQLFRNLGNENHWLEIDLVGVQSNPHGIGATVFVTAGGVTQMREQGGGIKRFAQNHQRLHFGLAQNLQVESVVVHWPSGIVQTLNFVPADQVLEIVESDSAATSTPTATASPTATFTPSPASTATASPTSTTTVSTTPSSTSTSTATSSPEPSATASGTPTGTAGPPGYVVYLPAVMSMFGR